MPDSSLLFNLLIVLGGASAGGLLASKLKQPIIFGYVFSGLLISMGMTRLNLPRNVLGSLAEIGLALLMFSLGLELPFERISRFKKVVLGGACLQIFFTILIGSLLMPKFFGFSFRTSLILSSAFSLSSTAIVVKILQEKGELESVHGEIMFGWLLVQDLAVLPLISLLPIFSTGALSEEIIPIAFNTFKAFLVVVIVWLSAKKIVPRLVGVIASCQKRELLLLFVVTLVFLFAMIVSSAGFSLALGAFLVGVVLSHVPSNFAIFSEIRPLRDVFLAIFFVSLGLSLNPAFIFLNAAKIVFITFFFLALKLLLSVFILSVFKYHAKTVLKSGFGLAEVGEFSFVYVTSALMGRSLSVDNYSLAISVTLLSMVVTPILFWLADKVYDAISKLAHKLPWFYNCFFADCNQRFPFERFSLVDHIIIVGYGRVGRWIGNMLKKMGISYIVVEYNPKIVRELKLKGQEVIFGDPSDIDILETAQVHKAKLIVLAIPDILTQKIVVSHCRYLNPSVKIICRSHDEDCSELKSLGVNDVIQPEFEAALSISHRILQNFGFSKGEVSEKIRELREDYES